VLNKVKAIHEEEKDQLARAIDDLKVRFPDDAPVPSGNDGEEIDESCIQIDWTKVPELEKDNIRQRESILRLLSGIEKAHSRCLVSNPVNAMACDNQRRMLSNVIKESPGISKQQLDCIVSTRITDGLKTCEVLANLITAPSSNLGPNGSYLNLTRKINDLVQEIHDEIHRNSDLVTPADWKVIRDQLLADKERRKGELQDMLRTAMQEKEQLEASTDLRPLSVQEIRRDKTNGLLSWTWLGGGWAEHHMRLGRDSSHVDWFQTYAIEGSDYEKTVHIEEPAEGVLDMFLKSSRGHHLRVDVKLLRQQKDLPSSQIRVDHLKRKIEEGRLEYDAVQRYICRLKAVNMQQEFVDIVVEKKKGLEAELQKLQKQKEQLIDKDMHSAGTEGQVMDALAQLFKLLMSTPGGLSKDLGDGPRSSIEDFVKQYDRSEQLSHNLDPNVKRYSPRSKAALEHKSFKKVREDAPPVNQWMGQVTEKVDQVKSISSEIVSGGFSHVQEEFERSWCSVLSNITENWMACGTSMIMLAKYPFGLRGALMSAGCYLVVACVECQAKAGQLAPLLEVVLQFFANLRKMM
jgi:hypothetical protein